MSKYFVLLTGLFVLAMAQRPPYAGGPHRSYPPVLPQYLPATNASNDDSTTTGVNERFGGSVGGNSSPNYEPYDPYNDQELINRIKTWPKEKQPFWYLNREVIAAQQANRITATRTTMTQPRSSFVGRSQQRRK